jgi:hypothetical protein
MKAACITTAGLEDHEYAKYFLRETGTAQTTTELTGVQWNYIKVLQKNFERLRPGDFEVLAIGAFTEQGVAMLSSVLRSGKAIQVNIAIMRAFVALRRYALTYAELAQKTAELETKFEREFADVHEVLRWLGEENQVQALRTTINAPAISES